MLKKACWLAVVVMVILLTGCKGLQYEEIAYDELPEALEGKFMGEAGVSFLPDPVTGDGYLYVSTGREKRLFEHVKFEYGEYDAATKTFTAQMTQFVPDC